MVSADTATGMLLLAIEMPSNSRDTLTVIMLVGLTPPQTDICVTLIYSPSDLVMSLLSMLASSGMLTEVAMRDIETRSRWANCFKDERANAFSDVNNLHLTCH